MDRKAQAADRKDAITNNYRIEIARQIDLTEIDH